MLSPDHDTTYDLLNGITSYRSSSIIIFSLKVEKRRDTLAELLPLAHIVFVGKDFALLQGARDCMEACKIMQEKVQPGTLIICPWGEQGASYCVLSPPEDKTSIIKIDAVTPKKIIDSLGEFELL
jgi:hypothetical protein